MLSSTKKYIFTGLVILLPVAVTIAIVTFIVNFLTKPFVGIVTKMLSHWQITKTGFLFLSPEQVVQGISQLLILIGLLIFTVLLGIVTRWFFFNALINLSDKILHKIPLVNKVYKTTQDIIKTLFASEKNSFQKVVMVPFPLKGVYSIGLVSRESPQTCNEAEGHPMVSVFVPTTPNPTTGFLLMFKEEDLIHVDMKTEDAVKYVVSCGVIIPEAKKTEEES